MRKDEHGHRFIFDAWDKTFGTLNHCVKCGLLAPASIHAIDIPPCGAVNN